MELHVTYTSTELQKESHVILMKGLTRSHLFTQMNRRCHKYENLLNEIPVNFLLYMIKEIVVRTTALKQVLKVCACSSSLLL